MNATAILNKILPIVSPNMHKTRRKALSACVLSLAQGSLCTVTSIGRGIQSNAYEKHRIKRSDRLLSNPNLRRESIFLYAYICKLFIVRARPVISIDWSDLDARGQYFLIRASTAFEGRSITLYEEVHDKSTKEKQKTHQKFLQVLKALLPVKAKPIIVTDAGFKTPWLDEVIKQGWDYVGRVRKPRKYYDSTQNTWHCISSLYPKASSNPISLELTHRHSSPITNQFVLYKSSYKGRQSTTRKGQKRKSGTSLKAARGAKDPWLLISNLPVNRHFARRCVKIYETRMQIEEGFRDMKSSRFGLGFELSYTFKIERLINLMLLTTLTAVLLILVGKVMELSGYAKRFQVNTIRKRRVLSHFYLGKRAVMTRFEISKNEWRDGIRQLLQQLEKRV
ncbi:Transposase DDE domain protein [Marinomonas aquimarina]|uniref:Transposase DDE domain protein n=1 Tax=Marinomonas aquimarina TaxID=295068 RepID=A0A1A8TTU4_9GAMM|nr:IS4 family transposase [Marinomonas aquimarina]SBS36515.1 Transposase DDE domain protein [Marinomonas aquimarina]